VVSMTPIHIFILSLFFMGVLQYIHIIRTAKRLMARRRSGQRSLE
jgi:hypothetical protein